MIARAEWLLRHALAQCAAHWLRAIEANRKVRQRWAEDDLETLRRLARWAAS